MATGACVENVHYLNVVRVNTLTSYGVAVTLVAPIQHHMHTGVLAVLGFKVAIEGTEAGGAYWDFRPQRETSFHT